MTVSSIDPVNNYAGNSSNTKFDFDFLIENENELIVQHTSSNGDITVLQNGVDYTIHEIGNSHGSYITFPISGSNYQVLASNEKISLMLTIVIKQEKEIRNSLFFNFDTLEWMFDYIVRILQVIMRRLTRTLQIPEGRDDFNMVLPIAKANNVFKWNETEDAIENYDIIGANTAFQTGVNSDLLQYKSETNSIIGEFEITLNSAVVTANTAKSTANSALSNSNTAVTNASSAVSLANNALSNSSSALTTSNTAFSSASDAVQIANSANQTAETASNKVDEFGETIETVLEAASQINALEQAVSTATTAATQSYNSASTASSSATLASEKAQQAIDAVALIEQSNWTETNTTSKAYIQNKPTLASVATSGSYNDLLNKPDNLVTSISLIRTLNNYSYRSRQIVKVANDGNISTLKILNEQIDTIFCTPVNSVTFTFPDNEVAWYNHINYGYQDYDHVHTFELCVIMRTVQSLTFPSNVVWLDNEAPDLSEVGVYFLVFRTIDDGGHWIGNLQGKFDINIALAESAGA